MFKKVLIANRGEIAVRIIKTLRRLGIASVAVYSDADRFAVHVRLADEAIRLGPAQASESYLNVEAVIAACKATGAEAVHPGYGFLSENIGFSERLQAEGIAFIGPTPENIASFGLKHTARQLAADSGVPLLPGSGLLDSAEDALSAADLIGYPVMLKSTAGGGGIGMQLCHDAASLQAAFDTVQRTAKASFGDARVYLERFVSKARHVEVQIFGDGQGRVIALGERDCSLQRRNQKVIEETPAPGLSDAVRQRLHEAAVSLGRSVHYRSAGTVEFIYDPARQEFYFLEVNTRLQVEHPITESVFGIDLVEWMIRQAADEDVLTGNEHLVPKGAAIEARIYAEMPHADFRPSAGLLTDVVFAKTARVDGWIETGTEVTPYYDPMLAKLIVSGKDREAAIAALQSALSATSISGIETNLDYLSAIAASDLFLSGDVATTALKDFSFVPDVVEVIAPGAQSSLQELPGRLGLWHVGVPPSGPMDARSFRHANRLVGNGDDVAALELTVSGPMLKFFSNVTLALAGAEMAMTLDGAPVAHNTAFTVKPGQVLAIGGISGPGQRAYLAVSGGFAAPVVLGSRATFGLGQFGGNATGTLKVGHVLRLARSPQHIATPAEEPPELTRAWSVGVVYGPHGAPDFFLDSDIETLFSTDYEVHFNSARTGVRLIGPAPTWARQDGGEAGLHPSNLHDNAYAIGAIDFTGDMPIILGPDGPSLGGFVCPAVIAGDEQWKMGQFKPGDTIRFHPVARDGDRAAALRNAEHGIPPTPAQTRLPPKAGSPILSHNSNGPVCVTYRRQGDDNLLVEYGEMQLDIAIRMRVHLLMQAVKAAKLPGLIDLTPGIRSLQIHYDGTSLSRVRLLGLLNEIEANLPPVGDVTVPSRTVYLPLSWNDPEAELAMRKYQELVRPNAPWCPSNIEFIRRINGLADEQAVKDTIFNARYLVMGLGDVYLGAPVATPLDPRHRLVTTKYNPARTWTPENAVGIGGAYMCIYGMEGPGGYQLFGRTIQMWNTWRQTPVFTRDKPWLLDFFDQIRFFPVSHDELMEARAAFPHGGYPIRIEDGTFSYASYAADLAENAESIGAFKRQQQAAFEAERQRWKDQGLDSFTADEDASPSAGGDIPDNCFGVESAVPGNLWKVLVEEGQSVAAGETIAIIESMKMEITVTAHAPGILRELRVVPGKTVKAGDVIAVLQNL
ncbi:urea carboxylase [Agrobacterium vitis]|uniref:Urea carboxylase n=1 Tax=Agrobacterium vitis TaxID=373 RepID=A0ABD6G7E5_AGRVI|nr:urea carboxylase [Agrobacterium vitis]MUO77728.1 urea carboxylase [Agrobacterium vitis]MUO93245.1 urea carboxylase [Agrobacterium vitis]MUP04596.1 urea carboxylase [Agrobacterium vitis]MUZ80967.1 urea carboxylase [Agrobacterium vitis]MVA08848.1 urea carboxylase [Agrobacterium vitis]